MYSSRLITSASAAACSRSCGDVIDLGRPSQLERSHAVRLCEFARSRIRRGDDVLENLIDRLRIALAFGRCAGNLLELVDESLQLLVAGPVHQCEPLAQVACSACRCSAERLVFLE